MQRVGFEPTLMKWVEGQNIFPAFWKHLRKKKNQHYYLYTGYCSNINYLRGPLTRASFQIVLISYIYVTIKEYQCVDV